MEIWRTDGTESGTEIAFEIMPGVHSSEPHAMVVYEGELYFSGWTREHGLELHRTDGTQGGTYLVEDLIPGPESSGPRGLTVQDDTLWYFARVKGQREELRAMRKVPRAGFSISDDLCEFGTSRTVRALEPNPLAHFQWTLSGATIESGQGTRNLNFSVDTSSEVEVHLTTSTERGSTVSTVNIPVVIDPPPQPEVIIGDNVVCQNGTQITYYVNAVSETARYEWSVPPDACIVAGQGTPSILIDFGQAEGAISVFAFNDCGASPTATLPVSFYSQNMPSNAGPDQNVCDSQTLLEANTVAPGSGSWSILNGIAGTIHEPNNPHSLFSGLQGETYELEWFVNNGPCESTSSTVQINLLAEPELANAGPDQSICELSTSLSANMPPLTQGRWEIISGNGGHISQLSDPHATFSGLAGEEYTLRWTLWGAPCPNTTDEVHISLGHLVFANAGSDQCALLGESVELRASGVPGRWSVVSGPDLSAGQFSDRNSPNSSFLPMGGPGRYELQWVTLSGQCPADWDDVSISVVTSVLTEEIALEEPFDDLERDIGPYSVDPLHSSNGLAFFTAKGHLAGRELWESDGTLEGTRIVSDHIPGIEGLSAEHIISHNLLHFFDVTHNNRTHLLCYDSQNRITHLAQQDTNGVSMALPLADGVLFTFNRNLRALWKSDGTLAGTTQIMTFHVASTAIYKPVAIGNNQSGSFFAYDRSLWKTDGTQEGTVEIHDLDGYYSQVEPYNGKLGDILFFTGGGGLWRTDGSTDGTFRLGTGRPEGVGIVFENMLFFPSSSYEPNGSELWRTDGTTLGTTLVVDLYPGAISSTPILLGRVDGKIIFSLMNRRGTWVSDGTFSGTEKISEEDFVEGLNLREDLILLRSSEFMPDRIFRSDGTSEGTQLLINWRVDSWAKAGDVILIAKNSGLYRTDGTVDGSSLFSQIQINYLHPYWSNMTTLGENLVFLRENEMFELWASNGSAGNAQMLLQIDSGPEPIMSTSGSQIFLAKPTESIWYSNGTALGTGQFLDTSGMGFSKMHQLLYKNGELYFSALTADGLSIWASDGTQQNTRRISSFLPNPQYHQITSMVDFNAFLFVIKKTGNTSTSLWRLHPQTGETIDFLPQNVLPNPSDLKVTTNGNRLFLLSTQSGNSNLVVTDGTQAGTSFLNINHPYSRDNSPFEISGNLAFCQNQTREVFRSDGTLEGTFPILNLDRDAIFQFTPDSSGGMYIVVRSSTQSDEIWFSDGTSQGTYLTYSQPLSQGIPETIGPTASINGSLFFSSTYGGETVHMRGTEAGCHWDVGPSFVRLGGFEHRSFLASENRLFLYRRDNQWKNQLITYFPPTPMPLDSNLRDPIIALFDENRDTIIDHREMAQIRELDLSHRQIRDTTGLEFYQELEIVDLSFNRIEDVSPLLECITHTDFSMKQMDLSHNLLDSDDCAHIGSLISQLSPAGLQYKSQGGIQFEPLLNEWPRYNIMDLIAPVTVKTYDLQCDGEAQ